MMNGIQVRALKPEAGIPFLEDPVVNTDVLLPRVNLGVDSVLFFRTEKGVEELRMLNKSYM